MQETKADYHIRVIKDLKEFDELDSAWNALLDGQRKYLPFLCHEWFKIWLKHFLNGNELFILLTYNQSRLVAIAPFIIKNEKFRGTIKVKKIELIGNVNSPLRNLIVGNLSQRERSNSLLTLFEFFQNQYKKWDVIELDSMPEEDPIYETLKATIASHGLRSREYFCFGDWFLDDIDCSAEEYFNKLPKKARGEIKRRMKRLQELGSWRVEIGKDLENFERNMNLYYQVRNKSWKAPETDGTFHWDVREMTANKGWMRFGFLFLSDEAIAAQIRCLCKGTVYFMESLYDDRYKKFAPGTILRSELIKYFIDQEQVKEIDQGRGDESYKEDWTPTRRERKGLIVFNDSPKGQLLAFLMTKIMPMIEKHRHLSLAQKKVTSFMKKIQ